MYIGIVYACNNVYIYYTHVFPKHMHLKSCHNPRNHIFGEGYIQVHGWFLAPDCWESPAMVDYPLQHPGSPSPRWNAHRNRHSGTSNHAVAEKQRGLSSSPAPSAPSALPSPSQSSCFPSSLFFGYATKRLIAVSIWSVSGVTSHNPLINGTIHLGDLLT